MLTEFQIEDVWKGMLAAETRALYFASLASRYSHRKQWIVGISFFLSSGVVVTLLAKLPNVVAIAASVVVAVLSAYSIAVGLDRKVGAMAKLHLEWQQIATDYNRLWNHAYEDYSENWLEDIIKREREPSKLAAVEAPNDEQLMGKWESYVLASYRVS